MVRCGISSLHIWKGKLSICPYQKRTHNMRDILFNQRRKEEINDNLQSGWCENKVGMFCV